MSQQIGACGNDREQHQLLECLSYSWDIFEDTANEGRFLETFMVASWLEHLRQHQRVTNADRVVQDALRQFDAAAEPKVTHFIAADFRQDKWPP
jgi:hypothetical protein